MSLDFYSLLSIDLPAFLTTLFAAVSCALLGNFLLLREQSLMGDAVSHAILPGIVVAFLLFGTRSPFVVFLGAAIAGGLSVLLIESVSKLGKLDNGTSMGVVFSSMFALGVLLMEQAAARSVDLDADCLLHGQLETIFWFPPKNFSGFFSIATLKLLPFEVITSFVVALISFFFVGVFYKELKIATFDSQLASSLGFNSRFINYFLMFIVAIAIVSSFKVVGSILVIAMLVCPAAIARMFTDRLWVQLSLSIVFSLMIVVVGYFSAAFLPLLLGFKHSFSIAGMIAVVAGLFVFLSVIFAPSYGVVARVLKRQALSFRIVKEDILGMLYRFEEIRNESKKSYLSTGDVVRAIQKRIAVRIALSNLKKEGKLKLMENEEIELSDSGRKEAKKLVRKHRLWESFLVSEMGIRADHVHDTAMQLEHVTSDKISGLLEKEDIVQDPHGRDIPK